MADEPQRSMSLVPYLPAESREVVLSVLTCFLLEYHLCSQD